MKNIYILPTDKPSRLHLIEDVLTFTNEYKNSVCDSEVNIYITNDEEIKEGDRYVTNNGKIAKELYSIGRKGKIILTTDQDLINDGVQAIDTKFLEWFVKNPSCEFVEIVKIDTFKKTNEVYVDETTGGNYYEIIKHNKIILPKEETKQETLTYTEAVKKEERIFNSTMMSKQETLEEAAVKYKDLKLPDDLYDAFIQGAKWQAERSYSEEEVRQMLFDLGDVLFNNCQNGIKEGEPEKYFDVIIEQFKKK
jgi:hypothetical protein